MTDSISSAPSCADPSDPESISVASALEQIRRQITTIAEMETLPIRDCLGRINAIEIKSPINVPAHANSAMDGFAIAFSSLESSGISELNEIGIAYAGVAFDGVCGDKECVRIMTGAVIP